MSPLKRGRGRSRSVFALVATGLLAVSLAACSGAGPGPSVPSLPDASGAPAASPSGSAGPAASQNPEDALLAFAKCMRDNGVDFPDPVLTGDGGQVTMIDPTTPGFEAAQEACEPLLPKFGEMDPAANQAFQDQLLAYARCMRDHGIDYPDPEFDGAGMSATELKVDPNSPAFQEADKACGSNLPGGGTVITGSSGTTGGSGTDGATGTNP